MLIIGLGTGGKSLIDACVVRLLYNGSQGPLLKMVSVEPTALAISVANELGYSGRDAGFQVEVLAYDLANAIFEDFEVILSLSRSY